MKKILFTILTILLSLNAQALFEVKDATDNTVLEVSQDGLRIFNNGDTLMVISSSEIKAFIDEGTKDRALSRSFSVTTSTSAEKLVGTHVFDITTDKTIMREGLAGDQYTNFSPQNILIGLNAGSNVTPGFPFSGDGDNNVLLGNNAGLNITEGENNVFVGNSSGYTAENVNASVFLGYNAGYHQFENHGNVYVGQSAGMYMESGGSNVFMGTLTGMNQASGEDNIIIGAGAAEMLYESGTHTGSRNVVLGADAGDALNGDNNVFIGFGAGYGYLGSNRLYIDNSTTATPLIFGDFATNALTINGTLTTTGNANLNGAQTWVNHSTGTSNGLYIKNASYANNWHFYQYSTGGLYLYYNGAQRGSWNITTGAYTSVSDKKFKKNIKNVTNILDKVMLLEPKKYNFKSQKQNDQKYMGFIAQEVEKLFPSLAQYNDEDDAYTMDYAGFSVVAIQAIKEQQEEINNLRTEIEEIKKFLNK